MKRGHDPAALREELKERCRPFLEPGEVPRHVFVAERGFPPSAVWTHWVVLVRPREYRIICVTDRAIVVLGTRDQRWIPEGVMTRLPRDIMFGPMTEEWASLPGLGGGPFVHSSFHGDVAAVDAELAAQAGMVVDASFSPPNVPFTRHVRGRERNGEANLCG